MVTGLVVFSCAAADSDHRLLSVADQSHSRNAFLHYDRQNHRDAVLHAARAQNSLPAKIIQWLLLTETDGTYSFAEALGFFTDNPDWPRRQRLQRAVERSMPANHPDAEILAWFDRHPPVSVDGAMSFIGALLRAGRAEEAHRLIGDTWRRGEFDVVSERNFHGLYGSEVRPEDDIARLDRLLWNRNAAPATVLTRRIGQGYPELAAARLALAARADGVPYTLRQVPAHLASDPGLNFERASWRMDRGLYGGVLELLLPLGAETIYPERWWGVRHWAVHQAMTRDDPDTAYRIASHHGLTGGADFAEAEWLAGWIALRWLRDPSRAYQHFARLHDGSLGAISRGRGAFWAAEAAAEKGEPGQAMQWYQAAAHHSTAFYGQLAAARLGMEVVLEPVPSPPSDSARARFAARELVRAVHLLGQLGQRSRQAVFLYHLGGLATTAEDYQLVTELAAGVRRVDISLAIGKQARNEGVWVPDGLFPRPPLAGLDDVETEIAWILAVIRQESAFDPRVVSPAGAAGLMQLMPATASAMAGHIQISHQPERLLDDPAYNIRLGSTYLGRLLERYDGDTLLTAAAYNAGPGRVAEWIERHGDPRAADIDPVDWIERIPFAETRNYVMRILESLTVYRLLQATDPGAHSMVAR